MRLQKRKENVEEKRRYEKIKKQFPTTMDTTYNAYVVLQVKVPAMLSAIIKSECSFLGVTEEAFLTNLIVKGIKSKESDREQQFKKFLNERKQNDSNRMELQHVYEQLGSKS